MKLISASTPQHFDKIQELYINAFPQCERKPFKIMLEGQERGAVDIWYIADTENNEETEEFAGLAITMKTKDLVLLDYFAIDSLKRACGYGSKALALLQEKYSSKRFFLEIENVYGQADNQELREKRKQFYIKNNMKELGMSANIYGTPMEILVHGCTLSYEEYLSVYSDVYGQDRLANIQYIPYDELKKY